MLNAESAASWVGAWRPLLILVGVIGSLPLVGPDLANCAEPSLAELLPRIPPREPQEALQSFQLQHGFSLELVAAEPDVVDPIHAAFDENGRMYVVEMRDYPFLPEGRAPKYVQRQPERFGSIRLLEDTDGNGTMDRSTVFADRLTWPQSVCCYDGGVFVIAPPNLWYMKDTTGDGVADVRENVLEGFGLSNVQALSNGLEWSFDHGIYWAGGRAGAAVKQGEKLIANLSRQDLRLDPKARTVSVVAGGEQYGHTFDDWGNRFVCNNSNHLEQVLLPTRYLDRNPQLSASNTVRTIAAEGAAAPVYRISPPEPYRVVRTARRAADPKFVKSASKTELVATGFFTSATGVTVYRGGAYPEEFQGDVFIGDVGGNLVHRKKFTPDGLLQKGVRTEEKVEFLASTDNWFRPVNFVNAPDGTLYVLDMYWETIEHPASIPEDIKEYLDLESGNDKGRIYRLVHPQMKRASPLRLGDKSARDLAALLQSPHGWVRETAHRLIWERQDAACEADLRALITMGTTPQSRLLALWSLQGLKKLTSADIIAGLKDSHPRVREQAVRLAEDVHPADGGLIAALMACQNDDDARVRWQLAFTLGEFDNPHVIDTLLSLARTDGQNPDMRLAILSSVANVAGDFGQRLLADDQLAGSSLTGELLQTVASSPKTGDVRLILDALFQPAMPGDMRLRHLAALADGLNRRGTGLTEVALAPETSSATRSSYETWLAESITLLVDSHQPPAARLNVATILMKLHGDEISTAMLGLLDSRTPPALQERAVEALASSRNPDVLGSLMLSWKGLGPQARKLAIERLLQSGTGVSVLLDQMQAGTVRSSELESDKQAFLKSFPDAALRERAQSILAATGGNRKAVVAQYAPALDLTGDMARGKQVYGRICIQCHRAEGSGHAVGPDMASVQNKSPEDLLIAILDPNREAQPIFTTYTALTVNGQVYSGIIAAENAANLTLRRAEAKDDVVPRDQLDELLSNGVSLMPEGLEKDLSPQNMADLIAFIKGQAAATKP